MKNKKDGFTLIEVLVVITIVAVVGLMLVIIFTNTLRGGNKAQIIAVIKQNGQAVLGSIDKVIKDADNVICPISEGDTLVAVKNGLYTRFRFIPPNDSSRRCVDSVSANGCIQQDNPVQPTDAPKDDLRLFLAAICTDPLGTDSLRVDTLTDTNKQTGVSVISVSFTKSEASGFKDSVTVSFTLGPGIDAPVSVAGQIDPVNFQTTIQLR